MPWSSRHSCIYFMFFFSSRRRHTRSDRDWSSDVCSSDLMIRHTRSDRDWSSDVCSSDLMIRHTRSDRDWSSDVCSSDPSELQSRSDIVCRLLLEKKVDKDHKNPLLHSSHNQRSYAVSFVRHSARMDSNPYHNKRDAFCL